MPTSPSNTTSVAHTSADLTAERLDALRNLIPEAFTEGKVDFDKLRTALGDVVDTQRERYSFTWAGKQEAIRLLQTPTRATLAPAKEESVNWDTTQNLFIEGDNLEVLKLLYKAYYGRVKMIYIDPPYNTGNDFVYPDDYADPLRPYLQLTGQMDAAGNLLTSNTEANGRYHSAWLSMMYPRLFIARQLLTEDGAIFVSIDDSEVNNLHLVMNELFGEDKFIASFIWKSRQNKDNRTVTGASTDHEYIVCYGKTIRGDARDRNQYANPDEDPRGDWASANMVGIATSDRRPNLHYDLINPTTGTNYGCPEMGWRYDRNTMARLIAEDRILWPSDPDGRPRRKSFFSELESEFSGFSTVIGGGLFTKNGTADIDKIFGARVFSFPKPAQLISRIIEQGSSEGDIVLDFFAGSGTTGHGVMIQNSADGRNRRYILVQLPEPLDPRNIDQKTAANFCDRLGKPRNIAELAKERLRRIGANIKNKNPLLADDIGFRVLKLSPSHFTSWSGTANATPADYHRQLEALVDPLIQRHDPEAVIWEVAIKEGFALTSRVKTAAVAGHMVYRVDDPDHGQYFHICLDDKVVPELAAALGLDKANLFVCRDLALTDSAAANLALQCRLKTI
jgi:adenine-specific DNA-methyltransferase